MRAINTEVDQHQLPLGECMLDFGQVGIIQNGQHAVPDVGSPQVVAIAAAFQIAKLIKLRQALQPIAAGHGKTLSDLALAWLRSQPGVTGAMVGIRNAQEAVAMVDGLAWQLTEDEQMTIQQAVADWDDERSLPGTARRTAPE